MPTRKQLIDQVRADQRARSSRDRADNPKSAIVGISDRDPMTGQYQVLLPDGSVEMGEKQFNSSLPKGSQVLGVPQSTGGWLLDERDVQPIEPIPQPSTGGKIKILYSQIEGDRRVFYLWGDRPRPKEVGRIPLSSQEVIYQVNNRGEGLNQFIVGLRWYDAFRVFSTKSLGEADWDYLNEPQDPIDYSRNDFYPGHGFWAFNSVVPYVPIAAFVSQVQPINYSVFKGIRKDGAANGVAVSVNLDGDILTYVYTAVRDLAPNISRTEQGIKSSVSQDISTFYNPVVVSKNLRTAIYLLSGTTVVGPNTTNFQYKLARTGVAGDIILGGTLPSSFTPGNLINDRLYIVAIPYTALTDKQWNVDVYQVGESTTKSTIKAKVTFRLKPGMNIHSASYHP